MLDGFKGQLQENGENIKKGYKKAKGDLVRVFQKPEKEVEIPKLGVKVIKKKK